MSTLTKEEREFIATLNKRQGLGPERIDLPGEKMNRILSIIDRLVAENEELRKDNRKQELLINHLYALEPENTRLETKLTALSGKSEPIMPKEVSVEEPGDVNADQLAYDIERYTGDEFSYYDLAAHLLTKYTIKEKV